MKFGF